MKPLVFKSLIVLIIICIFLCGGKLFFYKNKSLLTIETPRQDPVLGKPVEILDTQTAHENTFNDLNYKPSQDDFSNNQILQKHEITDEDIPLTVQEFN